MTAKEVQLSITLPIGMHEQVRDLAQARYTYLLSYMRLYSAAGRLGGEELRMLAGYFVAAR